MIHHLDGAADALDLLTDLLPETALVERAPGADLLQCSIMRRQLMLEELADGRVYIGAAFSGALGVTCGGGTGMGGMVGGFTSGESAIRHSAPWSWAAPATAPGGRWVVN